MPSEPTMSAEEFDALLPRLGRLSLDTVRIARAVVVDGQRPADVARRYGMSRQRVSGILRRFQHAERDVPRDWRRVEVWLPPDLAQRVEEMARDARAEAVRAKAPRGP